MPVAIQGPGKIKSPIEAIGDALAVVDKVYGIKANSAALDKAKLEQDALNQQLEQKKTEFTNSQSKLQRSQDPNSQESKIARSDAATFAGVLQNSALGKKNPQAFSPLLALANDPNTTAAALQDAYDKSPLIKNLVPLASKDEGAGMAAAIWGNRKDMQQNQIDSAAHQKTVQSIRRDPQLTKRIANYQNLENALGNVVSADSLTPQQIAEFQQTVRGSLGIGAGGVGEREHSYITSLGLNAENLKQFITGDPASISKDSALLGHFKNLAAIEQKNIGRQMDKRIMAVAGGNKSMYERRPDLKADLMDMIDSTKDQYAAQPQDAMQPSPSGAQGGGMIQDASAAGGKSAMPTADDIAAYQFAKGNPSDPRSAGIMSTLKAKGLFK
jgi:hypothetical protein